jgi:hypothetical protein
MLQVENVGAIDSGIVSMAWSPDYEFVVFATGNGTLMQMTNEWEVVTEVPIDPASAEIEEFKLVENYTSSTVQLSWRGDGKFFVCNSKDLKTGLYHIVQEIILEGKKHILM